MDPYELQFLAENSEMEIVPNFNEARGVDLLCGKVGPFRAGLPVLVPLWMAQNLKSCGKCRILRPNWLSVENLEAIIADEKKTNVFTRMPDPHYMEIAQVLFRIASEDIEDVEMVKALVRDFWDVRIAKLRTSVQQFIQEEGVHASLPFLTQLEINTIRPILPDALNMLQSIKAPENDSDEEEVPNNTTTNTSRSHINSSNSFSI